LRQDWFGVRRETGGEYEVKVLYGEGHAHHTGPEPCVVDREVGGEASAGGGIGQVLSRETILSRVPTMFQSRKAMRAVAKKRARAARPGEVRDPGMCSSSPRGNREVSRPSGTFIAGSRREGEEP
jgi:hypothetical protein